MAKDKKNTLLTPQSTKPFDQRLPFKNPFFQGKTSLPKNDRISTSFRTQNRGGGGK
ncbi:MAG: hypothetical protein WC784_00580 [Candidatus Shapirobacteria bacterium]|jgi:hypothetical protein